MNNNQTTTDTTAEEKTVTTSDSTTSGETTSVTTTETTSTDNNTTTTTTTTGSETTTAGTAADTINGVYDGTSATGPFALQETFSAANSTLITESGDTFAAINVSSVVTLNNNNIINRDSASAFLRATNSQITMTLSGQVAEGDILLDNLSTLKLTLSNQSYYMGIINYNNLAKEVTLNLDGSSQLVLAGDSYVDILENVDATNQNIYGNGYKLYVAGKEVAVNGSAAPESPEVQKKEETETKTETETVEPAKAKNTQTTTDYTPFIVGGAAVLVIILAIILIVVHGKKKKAPASMGMPINSATPGAPTAPGAPEQPARPDFSAFDDGPVAQPIAPIEPAQPIAPAQPVPEAPVAPVQPTTVTPGQATPAAPVAPTTPETPASPNPFQPSV